VGRRLFWGFKRFCTLEVWDDLRRQLLDLRKAAEEGDAEAQKALGSCYCFGRGVGQNQRKAAQWFRKAAEQGDPDAQYSLGVSYYKGQGVHKDLR
jgi:TPR repeat protein